MDNPTINLYKTCMTITAAPTRFIESFHYLPDPRWTGAILAIRRAGHVAAGRDYAVDRMTLQGDDLIYCLSGAGVVRTGEEQHDVGPGELVWLSGSAPHAHAAVPDDPWTVMWMRLDGPQTETCRARLMGESATLKQFAFNMTHIRRP